MHSMITKLSLGELVDEALSSHLQHNLSLTSSRLSQSALPTHPLLRIVRAESLVIDKQFETDHMLVLVNGGEPSKYSIISRGKQNPLKMSRGMFREYLGGSHKERRMEDLGNIINHKEVKKSPEESSIGVSVLGGDEVERVYLSYVREIQRWVLCREVSVWVIDSEEKHALVEVSEEGVGSEHQIGILEWLKSLSGSERDEMIDLLSNNTLLGRVQSDSCLFQLLINTSTGEIHNLQYTSTLFQKYRIPFSQPQLSPHKQYQSYEDLQKILQDHIVNVQDSWCLQHKIIRVANNHSIIIELKVSNKELLIYQDMRESVRTNNKFTPEKGHFPVQFYHKFFKIYTQYSQQLQKYTVSEAVKLILYSKQMIIPLERVLASSHVSDVTSIDYDSFEDCELNTFIVYLFALPEGCNRTRIIQSIKGRVEAMDCTCITVSYQNRERLLWNEGTVEKFVNGEGVFERSKYSFILMDMGFHPDIPHSVAEFLNQSIPPHCHHRVFHVMPETSHPFSFLTQTSSKPVTFPFDADLILYSLKTVEKRGEEYDKSLTPIENLAKLIHHISFSFKNYGSGDQGSRLRIIHLNYPILFKEPPDRSILLTLQQLLDFSYKKQYTQNQYTLHYFLQALSTLDLSSQPDPESMGEQVLMYSFRKLPFFPIP